MNILNKTGDVKLFGILNHVDWFLVTFFSTFYFECAGGQH